jgi:hypothetical protein
VLTCSYMRDIDCGSDRLNVISSGSVVYMKIDAKVCFQGDHLAAILVQLGRNLLEI